MTLDLATVTRQIATMAEGAPWRAQADGLVVAMRVLLTAEPAALRERIAAARTSWLVAGLVQDALAERIACPPLPPAWSVLATDGSSMTPDRHSPVEFHLLNIGRVRLRYGPDSDAGIDAAASLAFRPDETHLALPDGLRRLPIDGARLAAKRAVAELTTLAELAETVAPPVVALQDGSLILWAIQNEEEPVQEWVLGPYLEAAERLRRANRPLAAYISNPASTDVVNALRVAACPHVPVELPRVNCDRCPSRGQPAGPACNVIPSTTDRRLFERLLRPGERSALFRSASKILDRYRQRHPDHDIVFFYLHAGQEIARVEIPVWVAADRDLLDLVHAAIYDQAVRGQGYPTALQEAHEAAVIHADERRLVERLIEETMARAGATMWRSAKDTSKRVRAL